MGLFRRGSLIKSAHIKKGTHGSSNEISMSVLDAARNKVEAEHGEAERPKLGVISLFTLNKGRQSSIEVPSSTLSTQEREGSFEQETIEEFSGLAELPNSQEAEKAARKQEEDQKRQKAREERRLARMERKKEQEQKRLESKKAEAQHASTSAKSVAMPRKSMEENIARRKARRKMRRIALVAVVVLVCMGALGVGAYQIYDNYQGRLSQAEVVEKGLAQIVIADEDLSKLNSALESPSSEESQETLAELKQDLPQTKIALQRAQGLLDRASEDLEDERDKEAVTQARKAIDARSQMIESGLELADKILNAFQSRQVVEQLWNRLLEIDAQARTNAELLLDPTSENLASALTGIETTRSDFSALKEQMQLAETGYAYINLDQYELYIDKRLAALEYAEKAITALQEEDLDTARDMQAQYSTADNEAASWAAKFPKQITSIVDEAYAVDAKQSIEDYTTARTEAGGADDMLREYYGQRQK